MCRNLWTWIIILFCFQYCCMYTVVIVFLTILHQRIAFLLLFHFHIWFDHLFDLCFFNTRIADNNFFWQLFVWAGKVGAGKIKKWWSFRPHSSKNFGAGKVVAGLTTYHFCDHSRSSTRNQIPPKTWIPLLEFKKFKWIGDKGFDTQKRPTRLSLKKI